MKRKYRPILRGISAVLGNLSAGWFGVAMITPNLINLGTTAGLITLTKDLFFGIVFLVVTILVERILEK